MGRGLTPGSSFGQERVCSLPFPSPCFLRSAPPSDQFLADVWWCLGGYTLRVWRPLVLCSVSIQFWTQTSEQLTDARWGLADGNCGMVLLPDKALFGCMTENAGGVKVIEADREWFVFHLWPLQVEWSPLPLAASGGGGAYWGPWGRAGGRAQQVNHRRMGLHRGHNAGEEWGDVLPFWPRCPFSCVLDGCSGDSRRWSLWSSLMNSR